jgi:glutaredoxin 3
MMPSKVMLYVKTGCPWCSEAEVLLKRHAIDYDRIDVMRDRAGYETMRRISGQSKAPTMEWDDEILADFGAEELEVFLQEHHIS